jgi:hypothetical protein
VGVQTPPLHDEPAQHSESKLQTVPSGKQQTVSRQMTPAQHSALVEHWAAPAPPQQRLFWQSRLSQQFARNAQMPPLPTQQRASPSWVEELAP